MPQAPDSGDAQRSNQRERSESDHSESEQLSARPLTNRIQLMLPMVELTIFALGILLIDLMLPKDWKWLNAVGAFVGVAFAALCVWQIQSTLPRRSGRLLQLAAG